MAESGIQLVSSLPDRYLLPAMTIPRYETTGAVIKLGSSMGYANRLWAHLAYLRR